MAIAPEEVRLAEYAALRAETSQRAGLQQAIIALNLTVAGAISGFVAANRVDEALFVVPALASSILGLLWVDHHLSIHQIATYVRDVLWCWEPSWELYARKNPKPFLWRGIYVVLISAMFIGLSVTGLALSIDDLTGALKALWWLGLVFTVLQVGAFAGVLAGSGEAAP